jgi:hypothetical protein
MQDLVGFPTNGSHWSIVEDAAALAGAPTMLLVMVTVQVTVAAPKVPAPLH